MKPSAFLTLMLLCVCFMADALSPVHGARFIEIESGARHTCALTDGGQVHCWGRQSMGGGEYPLVASERYRETTATMIARGTHQGFAIATDGKTLCWGENDAGQCDVVPEKFMSISGADKHACGVNDRQAIYCWGADTHMNLSSFNGGTFSAVASGYFHSCGLDVDGAITCAGCERGAESRKVDFGQCDSDTLGDGPWQSVTAGRLHTCALKDNGEVRCIGASKFGQTDVPANVQFDQVEAGSMHTCGIEKVSGRILCWGRNKEGQSSPPAAQFTDVSGGFKMSCGLKVSGEVTCWGEDSEDFLSAPVAQ